MNESFELFNKISWFVKPVSKAILFMFTTKAGIFLLIGFLILYVVLTIWNAIHVRALAYRNSSGGFGKSIPFIEKIYIAGSELFKVGLKVISNLPVLLGVLIFMIALVGMSSGFQTLDEFLTNQREIRELEAVLRHLETRYEVAEMEIIDVDIVNYTTTVNIRYSDPVSLGFKKEAQKITVKGNDIYFDAIVLNFEYSEIQTGEKKNIVIPYRLFSEAIPQDQGVKLELKDENGVPIIFHRKDNDIYGISAKDFNNRLKEIAGFFTDPEAARKAGVRSINGNAVHKRVRKGDVISIWVEQTGGIVIKNKDQF